MTRDALIDRLSTLQEGSGPFVSLYLETRGDYEQAPQQIQTRWRDFRRERASDGVPEKALLLLDDLVEGAHREGRGLFALTDGEELSFVRHLPQEISDGVSVGPLPSLLPFLEWVQEHPAYAIVNVDRTGGEIHVVGVWGETTIEVEGEHDEIRKVNPGGWSQRRFQNRAEDSWEQNAEAVAEQLTKIMRAEGLTLGVLLGDVRARSFLKEHVPSEIAGSLLELDVDPHHGDDFQNVRGEIEAAVARLVADKIETELARFREERGQSDLASDGVAATFAALRIGKVETLLVRPGLEGSAWFSRSNLSQGDFQKTTLTEIGIEDVSEGPLDDVKVRSRESERSSATKPSPRDS
jgi:hypothetical protein